MCAALRREPHFENHPPSILVTVGNFKLSEYKLQGSLKRNARTALTTSLGVRQGGVIYKEKGIDMLPRADSLPARRRAGKKGAQGEVGFDRMLAEVQVRVFTVALLLLLMLDYLEPIATLLLGAALRSKGEPLLGLEDLSRTAYPR